jgi:hypothetical protein
LNYILFNDFSAELVELLAEALLLLIIVNQQSYVTLIQSLVTSQQQNAVVHQRLSNAFTALTSSGGLQLQPNKQNIAIFSTNFSTFLMDVKSIMLTK